MLQFFHTGSLTKYSPDTISAAGSSAAPASSDIYGGEREKLEEILRLLLSRVDEIRDVFRAAEDDNDPVEHCLGRIKSDESMREKCRRNNLPETAAAALQEIHDAIGIRVVCAFLNDVYMIRDRLLRCDILCSLGEFNEALKESESIVGDDNASYASIINHKIIIHAII